MSIAMSPLTLRMQTNMALLHATENCTRTLTDRLKEKDNVPASSCSH
jgi:hypothetical protein